MKAIIFLIIIFYSHLLAQNYGAWSLTDSLNVPRVDAASVELENGNILVTGGADSIGLRDAEIFDYKTEKWDKINSMVNRRTLHKLVRLENGNVLAIGGYGTRSCEVYDAVAKMWTITDSLIYERSWGEAVILLENGNVLIAGGFYQRVGFSEYLSSCEIYNVTTSKWTVADSLKIAREYPTVTKLFDGRVLLTGGFSGVQGGELSDCEIYDPKTDKWTEVAPLNIARYEHSATLLPDGRVLVTGGQNYTDPQSPWLDSCELYDPLQDKWTIVNSLLVPHTLHNPILLNNGLLLIAGGAMNPEVWELYDPHNFSNVHIGNYPDKQAKPLINLLPNGKVLSAGGLTSTDTSGHLILSSTNVCYLYDPDGIDAIVEPKPTIVKGFRLYQNYPNPFNPVTTIKYELPASTRVVIKIYNTLGKVITTLVNKTQMPGIHTVNFNVKNLSSGVYFYQIITEKWTQTNKMLVLK